MKSWERISIVLLMSFLVFLTSVFIILLASPMTAAEIKFSSNRMWLGTHNNNPTGVGWGDFNHDGYLDLMIANGLDEKARPNEIYFNDSGKLNLTPGWISEDVNFSGNLQIGDLNHDGWPEAIIAQLGNRFNGFPDLPHVAYYNNPDLSISPDWNSMPSNGFSCALGDVDNDGDLDIAFAQGVRSIIDPNWSQKKKVVVYFNNDGVLESLPGWESDSAYYGVDVGFADLDLDGDLELLLGGREIGVAAFYNTGGALETVPSWQTTAIFGGRQIAFGDVNGDSYPDMAAAAMQGTIFVFKNLGGSLETTPSWQSLSSYDQASCVSWADADGDGDMDLAGGGWYNFFGIYENLGDSLTSDYAWKYQTSGTYQWMQQVEWADYDEDGLYDTTESIVSDGNKKLFYIKRFPIHGSPEITIDGIPLGIDQYCFDCPNGWISLADAPEAGSTIEIDYTYSVDYDLAATALERGGVFENQTVADSTDIRVLLLTDNQYGANYNYHDANNSILEHFESYGWNLTLAALQNQVYPCSYASGVGALPIIVDTIFTDIDHISDFDAIVILPNTTGQSNVIADQAALDLISEAVDSGLVVGAFCKSVRVLAHADVIQGLKVVGNADYQSEYEAAGAIFLGNDHPPVIQNNIVTGVRSRFYRTEICEAIKLALDIRDGVWIDVDTSYGWVPFEVEFTGMSGLEIDAWRWDFGDEDSAFIQNPTHIYDQRGVYDVAIEVEGEGKVRTCSREKLIVAMADTLKADTILSVPGETVEVYISGFNTIPLDHIRIPVNYSGNLSISPQGVSVENCRTSNFETINYDNFDLSNNRFTFSLEKGEAVPLEPGEGPVAKITFQVGTGGMTGDSSLVNISGYDDYSPEYTGALAHYEVMNISGLIRIEGCCKGMRGNVDYDPNDVVNIVDLTHLVAYVFGGGEEPECPEEANIDGGSSGNINVVDLSRLVEYLFNDGEEPQPCPY